MGCQKVSADICGGKKIYFVYLLYLRGVWGKTVVFFFISCEKNVTDLHILCVYYCVCACVVFCVCFFKFSFLFLLVGSNGF